MQAGSNVWSKFENGSTNQFDKNVYHWEAPGYLQSTPFGSTNTPLNSDSGPTSLPNFKTPMELSNSNWYETDRRASVGQSSVTMFGQTWASQRSSAKSSAKNSLGSQDWGQMIDQVLLNELHTFNMEHLEHNGHHRNSVW